MDESIDEFQENFKQLKENNKKSKLAQISKYMSPKSQLPTSTTSTTNASSSSDSTSLFATASASTSSEFKKPKVPTKLNDNKISKYFKIENSFSCPVCSADLTKKNDADRQRHVNICLDKDFAIKKDKNKFVRNPIEDKIVKHSADSDPKADHNKVNAENNSSTKNHEVKMSSSSLSESKKIVATEIESEEKIKKYNENLLKEAIPNCPICGKELHSLSIRQNHLKKCAQIFHIKTESLVELVKKQQDKLEKDLAKGLIPTDVYFPRPKKQTKKAKITNRVIKLEQPVNQQDEAFQMAIALSNSLDPSMECPKAIEKKLFKSKKMVTDTVLMLTCDETRHLNIERRFLITLDNKINYDNQEVDNDEDDNKKSLVCTKFSSASNYLWNRCRYFEEKCELFYIREILDKDKILTNNKPNQLFIEKTNKEDFENIGVINTQSAFLLADLAEQTQENVSIYLTQRTQCQSKLSSNNFTQDITFEKESVQEENSDIAYKESVELDKNNSDLPEDKGGKEPIEANGKERVEVDKDLKSIEDILEQKIELYNGDLVKEDIEKTSKSNEDSLLDMSSEDSEDVFNKPLHVHDLFELSSNSSSNLDQNEISANKSTNSNTSQSKNSLNSSKNVFCIDETQLYDPTPISFSQKLNHETTSQKSQNERSIIVHNIENHNEEDEQSIISILSSDQTRDNDNECDNYDVDILDKNLDMLDSSLLSLEREIDNNKGLASKSEENEDDLKIIITEEDTNAFKYELDEMNNTVQANPAIEIENDLENNRPNSVVTVEDSNTDKNMDQYNNEEVWQNFEENHYEDFYYNNESANNFTIRQEKIQINENSDSMNISFEKTKSPQSSQLEKSLLFVSKPPQVTTNTYLFSQSKEKLASKEFENLEQYFNDSDNEIAVVNTKKEKYLNAKEDIKFYQNENDCSMDELAKLVNFSKQSPMAKQKQFAFDSDDIVVTQNDLEKFLVLPLTQQPKSKSKKVTLKSKPVSSSNLGHEKPSAYEKLTKKAAEAETFQPAMIVESMPNFVSMDTPDLKNELKRFGIKALPKKQAIKKLVEIFEYTSRKALTATNKMGRSQSCINFKEATSEPASKSTSKLLVSKNSNKETAVTSRKNPPDTNLDSVSKKLKKTKSDVCSNSVHSSHSVISSSQPATSVNVVGDLKNYYFFEDDNDENNTALTASQGNNAISETQKLLKMKRATKTLDEEETKKLMLDIIKNNKNLYLSILCYETLDFENFSNELQQNAAISDKKINTKFVMKILDEMCVTFTLKNLHSNKIPSNKVKSRKKN